MAAKQPEIIKLKHKDGQNHPLFFMKWRHTPYIVILAFTVLVTIVRIFMVPEWSLLTHVLLFFPQYLLLLIIWMIITSLGKYFDKRLPFTTHPSRRMLLQILSSILLVTPLLFGIAFLARPYLPAFANDKFITLIIILLLVMTVLLNMMLAAFYFFNQWQKSVQEKAQLQVQTAEMQKERSLLQYHHLKNQVNPHFLFNTFSSLDGLIQTDPELASDFVRHLSKVYRYVLEHKENEVVSLQTEVDFIQHYISLLEIRYRDVLKIQLDISSAGMEKGIVMVTLQMLIDNAIKHNSLDTENPLHVRIWDKEGYLHVYNNKQLRRQIETSNKHGLLQLKELYSYLTKQKVIIKDHENAFEINLPLL